LFASVANQLLALKIFLLNMPLLPIKLNKFNWLRLNREKNLYLTRQVLSL
jgi:hypothetical protein